VTPERRCLIVGSDAAVTASVAAAVDAARGLTSAGTQEPAAALSGVRPACDAILLCDGPGRPALEIAGALLRGGAAQPVILLSRSVDLAGYRAALAVGARGLLPLPPDPDDLRSAVIDAGELPVSSEAPRRSGRAVAVCSVKGGCGASSVSLSLASAAHGLLVDLAGGFDDAASRLRCEPRRTLADVAGLEDALGGDALRSLICRHPSGLGLVARPASSATAAVVSPVLGRALVRECRLAAGLAAFDLGLAGGDMVAAVSPAADLVLIVTTPDPHSVACASRVVRWLDGVGVPGSSQILVVNRWSKSADLTLRGIERRVGVPLAAVVRDGELTAERRCESSSLRALAAELEEG
jgi:pilus assembly protein CpaE